MGRNAPLIERHIMDRNIESYVKVYNNFFTPKECKKILKQLNNINFKQHTYHDNSTDTYNSHENDLKVSIEEIPMRVEMMNRLWGQIHTYVNELEFPWYTSWSGYSVIRFNKYDVNTYMKIHADHIHSLFDGVRRGIPVLSIVGLLNDDYEGGEFIMWGDTKIELKTGDLIIFPSNFLYPHLVSPITKGVRNSFVSWVW